MGSRLHRSANAGLLVVCILLAGGLALTAVISYQAALSSARAVLHSRAIEVASSFAAAARVSKALEDREQLRRLAAEMASPEIGITISTLRGKVLVSEGGPGGRFPTVDLAALRTMHRQGLTYRIVPEGPDGGYLEHWQPIRRPPRGWRRHRPWFPWPKGPAPGQREEIHGPARAQLLGVTVAMGAAQPLLGPARVTAAMAVLASLVLTVLGIVLHRAAGRAQLVEKELQRRRALSALGEMAAVLAHEIRTPLSSIKGNAQLVGESWPGDRRIQAMVREAERLERLVNGLLDYARPGEPRRIPCDPDRLMLQAAEIVAPKAAARSVTVLTDPAGCGACLLADPDQLVQVLVNLLQNGVEACAAEGAGNQRVVVQVREGRGQVSFTVIDSGPGFEKMDIERLSRPFFSTKDQGTGLGLSIARQILQQHGGDLALLNRPEGGGAVRATVPRKPKENSDATPDPSSGG